MSKKTDEIHVLLTYFTGLGLNLCLKSLFKPFLLIRDHYFFTMIMSITCYLKNIGSFS